MLKKMLKYPEGYYVSENTDDHGSIHVLCRPDGTEVWSFYPVEVLECEVILTAFEDHSEQLSMETGATCPKPQVAPALSTRVPTR